MLAVIADDITGAAEIAGIAHRYGLSCQLTINIPTKIDVQGTDVLVIATDARSYSAAEAYDITADVTRRLYALIQKNEQQPDIVAATHSEVCRGGMAKGVILFRKTDSALRGNVQEELKAIIDNSPYNKAIYMPANPSKGRVIKDGVYYIRPVGDACDSLGTPISETDFRFDPEFPATSSVVRERFPNLVCPDAMSQDDVDKTVKQAMEDGALLAGAADMFTSLINRLYNPMLSESDGFKGLPSHSSKLIVRGSTQSKAIDLGIPVETMPLDVFYEKAEACTWAAAILHRLKQHSSPTMRGGLGRDSLILTIGDKEVRKGKQAAVYLRQAMAEVTCAILSADTPDELIIEGGATAYAILSQLPWSSFTITDEIATGVVRMKPEWVMGDSVKPDSNTNSQQPTPITHHPFITLKPGSYDWGKLFTF